jgi:hypothetical protein
VAKPAKLGERAEIAALQGGELAIDLLKRVRTGGIALPGIAEGADEIGTDREDREELCLDSHKAAAQPVAMDEGVDEIPLDGRLGLELLPIFGGEAFEVGGLLTGYHG